MAAKLIAGGHLPFSLNPNILAVSNAKMSVNPL